MHKFLAIESSCDESAVAVIGASNAEEVSIIDEEISSQIKIHQEYGGVVPEIASREHLRILPLMINQILQKNKLEFSDLSAVFATRGPGLKGCLLVGLGVAKGIAVSGGIPLLAVNHIEGHVLAPLIDNPKLTFPYLALVVSGGHTELVEVKGLGEYSIISKTGDDAAGEAFDKSAHLLGISYPGGAELSKLADSVFESPYQLPKVMREASGFSFSGLKTAISLLIAREGRDAPLSELKRAQIAHSIQNAIVDALIFKVKEALQKTKLNKLVVTGGVAANRLLRERALSLGVETFFPKLSHCTDNAAMIGFLAAKRFLRGERSSLKIDAVGRWSLEDIL